MAVYDCDMGDPLDMLVEECAEVIQAAMKYRRFSGGPVDLNPSTGRSARDQLVQEIGDFLAVLEIVVRRSELAVSENELAMAKERKIQRLNELFGYNGR